MASSSEKKVPRHNSTPSLINKVLHVGDSVRIGRKPTCEVTVKCPFISSIHCKIEVVGSKEEAPTGEEQRSSKEDKSGNDLHFFVSDLSSNGTWLAQTDLKSPDTVNRRNADSGKDLRSAKKLVAKTKEEIVPGDCILLLSPLHKSCMQYRFVVKRNGSECALEQLPATYSWSRVTLDGDSSSVSEAESSASSKSVKLESAATTKKSTTVGGGSIDGKLTGFSTSDCG